MVAGQCNGTGNGSRANPKPSQVSPHPRRGGARTMIMMMVAMFVPIPASVQRLSASSAGVTAALATMPLNSISRKGAHGTTTDISSHAC